MRKVQTLNALRSLAALVLVCSTVARPAATRAQAEAQRRGVTAEDYYSFEFAGDPHLSPDGRWVAYVVTTVDQRQNRRVSNVWLAAVDGSREPRQFTASPQSSNSPRWSPDGRTLAFLSARPDAAGGSSQSPAPPAPQASPGVTASTTQAGAPGATQTPMPSSSPAGSPPSPTTPGVSSSQLTASAAESPRTQVYVLSLDGGEARRVTNLRNGVSSFQWSPDGTRLALLGRTGASDVKAPSSDVRHYKHPSYKFNDTGWFDDKRSHVFVVDVATGAARQITSGDDWNDTDPQWSPDGRRIAFVSDRTGRAFDESRNTDVWVTNADGTGAPTKISDHDEADASPRFSPDGKWIAFTGEVRDRDHPKIFLAPASGGAPSKLAARALDLIPSGIKWAEAGRAIFFETGVRGEYQLFRVDVASGEVRQVTAGARAVRNVDINDEARKMVYAANDFKRLDDLYVAGLDGKNERQLTRLNQKLWGQLQLQDVERFTYKSADGWDVDGFLVKPLGWQEGRKYPMILSVHGGPAGQYGVDWYHEFQVYAARGWAVLFTNPRGSTGYGQKFERGIEGEWGGKDYQDVMNGVDAALARNPWIDRERLGVTGGSYGGFMTNWIVGHTNIFKAAVSLRSVTNFISDEGTRDGAYGHSPDFGGDLFERFDLYWDRSPLKYAKNVKTPILILHSENDFRVPLEQGEQWFRALKHYGATAEFVIFPRENHNLTRTGEPKHLVESLNWQIYWFDRYLNGNAAAVPPDAK
ncbi:MAG: S9 family peptidase [Acidobacteria bacterium]|nr:S9 family peptidase [Acidobacteriota bacterium]